jgi:hypothetical protein
MLRWKQYALSLKATPAVSRRHFQPWEKESGSAAAVWRALRES